MGIPLLQKLIVGSYVVRQRVAGRKRYPLVLMLEPLFRCNLACAGCGKIDYPDEILNQRLSYDECMHAIEECGTPAVSISALEPDFDPIAVIISAVGPTKTKPAFRQAVANSAFSERKP